MAAKLPKPGATYRKAPQRAKASKPAKTIGRPSGYSEKIANKICDKIAEDYSLSSILQEEGMPSHGTVMRWLRENEAFRNKYAQARNDQAEVQADAVRDLGKKAEAGEVDPAAARVALDALKWSAGRRNPKKYGDRVTNEHTGPNGGPIQMVDLSKLTDAQLAALDAAFSAGIVAEPGTGGDTAPGD